MLETREVQKTSRITRELGLALKVQLSKAEPIPNRAVRLMQGKKHKPVLSTIAAGVTNAGTKPLSVESQ